MSVTRIYNYFKKYGYKTEVMGASFRNLGEITELAGCDLLTIAPNFLAELAAQTGHAPAQARSRERGAGWTSEASRSTKPAFRKMHEADPMAKDKLDEGIAGLLQGDRRAREATRRAATRRCEDRARGGAAAREFFTVFDLDGDGFITREEWAGTDAVFAALDRDSDGRISPEEMAAGLGAAFVLTTT